MPDPDESSTGDADADPDPSAEARGGRPTQLTVERVAAFLDRHEATTGAFPSVREMQAALGGGRTKLVALRDQVRAERLVAAAAPEGSPVATAIARSVGAALEAVGLEAARGAERTIEAARAEADRRTEAAERVQVRAERVEAEAALDRERAIGRAEALGAELEALRTDRQTLERDLADAIERERALETTIGEQRVELVEQRATTERAEATVARLEREGGMQAESLERLGEKHEAATRRAAELETALARAEAERDGAVLRAEASVAQAERAEAILIDANARSDRAEEARAREAERHEHAYAALASARRIDVGTCHDRIEQLVAALVETDAAVPEPEVSLPAVEFQPGLALDGGQ